MNSVEGPDIPENLPVYEQRRAGRDCAAKRDLATKFRGAHIQAEGQLVTILVQVIAGRACHRSGTGLLQCFNLASKLVLLPRIIAVEKRDPAPVRGGDSCISCSRRASVSGMLDQSQLLAGSLRNHSDGLVRAAVVNNNYFKIGICLRKDTVQSAIDNPFTVENGNDDTHVRSD